MEEDFGQASVKCQTEIGDPYEKQLIGSFAEGRQYSPSVDMKLLNLSWDGHTTVLENLYSIETLATFGRDFQCTDFVIVGLIWSG